MASRCREFCCNNACTQRFCRRPECINRCLENETVKKILAWTSRNALLLSTVVAVVVGMFIGAAVRAQNPTENTLKLIGFPGELFLRALKMMVIPLIVASVVSGTTALDAKTCGRMTAAVLGYFLATSFVCALLGTFLGYVINPGHIDIKDSVQPGIQAPAIKKLDSFMDVLTNSIPDNLLSSCLNQTYTVYTWEKKDVIKENETDEYELKRGSRSRSGSNVLGLIVFFMTFGVILSSMGERGQLIAQYFYCLDKIIMKMVSMIIWGMPIGVASLICQNMASMYGKVHLVEDLVLYILTVVAGLAIHQFILLPLLYFLVLRENPFPFYWNIMQAIVTSFATESSAAALPVTIQNMEEKNHANKFVCKFILPIGATVNMNGTAMFVATASLFIAQINGHEVTIGEIITIIFTSTAVSVASSATPGAAIYLMAMTLSMLPDVPLEDVSFLLIMDWLLGRCRTTNNVVGDCYAVAIFQRIYKKELDELQEKEDEKMEKAHPFLKH